MNRVRASEAQRRHESIADALDFSHLSLHDAKKEEMESQVGEIDRDEEIEKAVGALPGTGSISDA